jgi:hypothetical protein
MSAFAADIERARGTEPERHLLCQNTTGRDCPLYPRKRLKSRHRRRSELRQKSRNPDAENLHWHVAADPQKTCLLAVWSPWSAHRRRRRREGRIAEAIPRVAAGRLHALLAAHECAARRARLCVHPAPGIGLRDCGLRPGCYHPRKYQRSEEAFLHGKSSSLEVKLRYCAVEEPRRIDRSLTHNACPRAR